VSPKQPEHSPTLTGNSFGALDVDDGSDEKAVSFGALDVAHGSDKRAADSDDSLYKAVVATSPDVGHILRRQDQKLDATVRRQDQKLDATVTTLMDILLKKMDDRFARMDDRFAELTLSMKTGEQRHAERFARMDDRFAELTSSMKTGEQRHVELLSHLDDRLLAKFDTFNGQLCDLHMDAIDHERRINDQNRRIDELKSNLLKLESVHKGYKGTNNELVATLRTDFNDTRAKIPELRRDYQNSAACLMTSINEVAALVHDPGGITPTFRGAASFPSGNCQTRDTAAPPDPGAHQTNHSMDGPSAPATPSPVPQGALRQDPSAVDLPSLLGGRHPPAKQHVTFNTPDRAGAHEVVPDVLIVGGPVTSPHPSDKERLARSRGVGLFDIAGLATEDYHGGTQGVQALMVKFIHNCGYQSFSNTLSPEDILVCLSEIQQLHRKVLQSWYNTRTQLSGPSLERILDRGLKAFILRTMDVHDAVEFYDKLQGLSHDYLIPLMPFDAVRLGNNFEGLFVPGLGTQRYHKCASALFELLPRLLPTSNAEIQSKLASVRVESKNGNDLLWRILELTVPVFDPTVPIQQPTYDIDTDILGLGRRFELYFRL